MNYGMYVAASGVLVNSHRMDVLANNLANVNTPGFKPQLADIQARQPETLEDGPYDPELSKQMLEQIGGGLFAAQHTTSYATASIVDSGMEYDVALTQPNTFFAVQSADANTGELQVQLTRNGRFMTNDAGQLTTQAGHPVLGEGDIPITIPAGTSQTVIANDGTITFRGGEGKELGSVQMQVVTTNTAMLEHRGEGLFHMAAGDHRTPVEHPGVRQFHYEGSGTNAVTTMMEIVAATKAATGNANMIRYHDQMLNQSINTFARLG